MKLSCCLFAIHNVLTNKRKEGREQEREILYVSHTKVTYGTERNGTKCNISVCQCTVKRSMLSCFPFMIWTNNSDSINCRSSNSSSSSLYIKFNAQKTSKRKKNVGFYFERRVEKRDIQKSNQFVWRCVGRDAECVRWHWRKKPATEKREKVFFPMAKTRNYVYYTIGKAHFVFDGTKKRMCITVKESRHGTEHNRTG